MEDTTWEELKILRADNKRLRRLLKPFTQVGKILSEFADSKEDFNSSYFTEVFCREYDFTLDGPQLEDFIKLYQQTELE